jgi:hypothetical protein
VILPAPPQTTVFIVEQYLPQPTDNDVERLLSALCAAATSATVDGTAVRLVHSLLISEDDLCLHLLAAASLDAAAKTAEAAGITAERIMKATLWCAP